MKKKILFVFLAFIFIAVAGLIVYRSGALVVPTSTRMESYTLVESNDILDVQYKREQDILNDYRAGLYTLENPYIIQDPYQANPLSAMVIFETEQPATTMVTVAGKDAHSTYSYTYLQPGTHHEIAVLGLYPDADNAVVISVQVNGEPEKEITLQLRTEPLPVDFPIIDVEVSKPQLMEAGVTLMIPCFETNYTYLLDANGDVRAYFLNKNFGHGTAMRMLENGRLIVTGDIMKLMPYHMYTLWEINLLGKVFVEYDIPNAVHHEIIELNNGDFLATSNNKDMPLNYDTREDVIVQIDRETGMVSREYDLRTLLNERRKPYSHFDSGVINQPNLDWAHLNSIDVDSNDGGLITSSPIQSVVVKFNPESSEIQWILSSHEGWTGDLSKYQKYLLTPIGDGPFEWSWGQHDVKMLPEKDNDADTIDLLVFDNGQSRSYLEETSVAPEDNYSRAVIYRINEKEMTIEQLWQYGKERGSAGYSTFLGSADYLPVTGNILVDFGGMLRSEGIPVDSIISGVLGETQVESRVVEVLPNGDEVFEIHMTPNNSTTAETYQARRVDLYTNGIEYFLGTHNGQRLGDVQSAELVEMKMPNVFIDRLEFTFNQLFEKNGYLILNGNFRYQDKVYFLGRLNFVLKNKDNQYIFQGTSGLNGNFYSRINLGDVEPGEYAIFAVGAVIEGKDTNGKMMPAYNPTGYKIIVK